MIKFICQPKYGSQQNGEISLDDVSKFPLIQNQLSEDNSIDFGQFDDKNILTAIKLANDITKIYEFISSENICKIPDVYGFCCKYGCLQVVDEIEKYIIDCDYDDIITSDMYVFAHMYSRQCIIDMVDLMIKDETLDKEFFYVSNYDIIKYLKSNQVFDLLLLKHNLDYGWVFYTMNDIVQYNCQIENRHIDSLNQLLIDACQDKKAEYHEDDVQIFLRFIESKGLNVKPFMIDECCCSSDRYGHYDCNNHAFQIFCEDPEYN
ncbi:hypothetical protein QLL95_gp0137 [Cotonvirus japonicus]|uniref:Ankyrin repeat protein n=1 Tax=Cotonvirus japonicus TaxID=2811091 RepID=A0ABM7NRA3_9VIRU|nr:hypothetical protein QLL95_gp0137 [Cotonvirus japonicus]BCS82626.1 hypothetical protein [Cotonvirus japonicus]